MRVIKSEIYFPIIIGFHLVLWAVDLSLHEGSVALNPGESETKRVIGEIFSSWVITVLGFNLLMATRARWVERIFGGLDKMYLIHRRAGTIAMILLLLHFGVVPRSPDFSAGEPLGFAAMALIFIGVVLAAAPLFKRRIPYHKWVLSHRLMGIFYLIGIVHSLLVPTLISQLPLTRVYVLSMAALGVLSWLYMVFLRRRVHPAVPHTVTTVRHWGKAVVELALQPNDGSLAHDAGQFAFFTFPGISARESHPFTIASADGELLRVVVKASGDFTAELVNRVGDGNAVLVEGPYGHFTPRRIRGNKQVWIAGGIGITPFLAMAEACDKPASLYWSVRTNEEAFFHEELTALADGNAQLSYTLWPVNERGYLDVKHLPELGQPDDLDILLCGPLAMRDNLFKQLRAHGVPSRRIHTEEFLFR